MAVERVVHRSLDQLNAHPTWLERLRQRIGALSVDDLMKKISVIQLEKIGVEKIGPPAMRLAEAEGLLGHKTAIELRLRS